MKLLMWAALGSAAVWFLGRMGVAQAKSPEPPVEKPRMPPLGSLGERALEVARSQVGVQERTGTNDGPQIARYFEGCTRIVNGKEVPTGWQEGWDWCAAFASWCGYAAADPGSAPPHGKRIAVWELIRDAKALNRWQEAEEWGSGPRPGDLVCWKRGGDPRKQGEPGHVSRCVSWDGARLVTIGGNELNRVREADVSADLPRAVGVIRY